MSILHLDIAWHCAAMSEGQGKAPGGVERHNVIIVIIEFGGAYQPPQATYDSQKTKKDTFTFSISLRSNKSNIAND